MTPAPAPRRPPCVRSRERSRWLPQAGRSCYAPVDIGKRSRSQSASPFRTRPVRRPGWTPARPLTGWVRTATGWRKDGWATRFDHSPTYTQGAPDGAAPYWQFVNPSFPMAAHPDQVWINGVAQTQVASLSQLRAGAFFFDEARSQLHIGSDPTGRTVEASSLAKALSVRASGTVIRGIGIRRYAPSVWMVAAVTLEATVDPGRERRHRRNGDDRHQRPRGGHRARPVTVLNSGMLGIHVRFADRLQLTSVLVARQQRRTIQHRPGGGGNQGRRRPAA